MLTNLAEAATKALDALNQHTISREKAMMAAFMNAGAQCHRAESSGAANNSCAQIVSLRTSVEIRGDRSLGSAYVEVLPEQSTTSTFVHARVPVRGCK